MGLSRASSRNCRKAGLGNSPIDSANMQNSSRIRNAALSSTVSPSVEVSAATTRSRALPSSHEAT